MWLGRAGFEMVNNRPDLNSPPFRATSWASLAATRSKNYQFYPFKSSAIDKVPNGVFPVLAVPMCIGIATTYSIENSLMTSAPLHDDIPSNPIDSSGYLGILCVSAA